MKDILLVFCFAVSASIYTSCARKNEKSKNDSMAYHPDKSLLQGKYEESEKNQARGKRLTKKKIKVLDKTMDKDLYVFSEWVSNVGEAMDMMK